MSRNGAPASSSSQPRYNISNPRPYVNDAQSSQYEQQRVTTPQPGQTGGSPARPARSRMRDAPQPAKPPRAPPIRTRNLGVEAADDPSPISPAPTLFTNPFEADRHHRTQMRDQASAAVQNVSTGDRKLRNVVGAFMSAGNAGTSKRPQERPKRQESDWNSLGTEGRFAEIDRAIMDIKVQWPTVLESDFSPSTQALALLSLDQDSVNAFFRVHDSLSSALQNSVQSHFQSFAASLPAHANFVSTLERAQEQMRTSKDSLRDAREGFAGKGKAELAGIKTRERVIRDMLKVLDTVDDLKQVPDRLEALIGARQFQEASTLLMQSIKTINRPDISDIGAVSDLRLYFAGQVDTLLDIMVDELHNQLYLKTFASDTRWTAFAAGQTEFSQGTSGSRLSLHLSKEETHDSYQAMETLLESLATMGRLGQAIETIVQRVGQEMHILIETTLDEVEERAESRRDEVDDNVSATTSSFDLMSSNVHSTTLLDLFWTLYAKVLAVLEGHRIIFEASRSISIRRDFKDSTATSISAPVLDIWRPIQQEMRGLLKGYLIDETQGLNVSSAPTINETLREGKVARDRQRPMFKFADTDLRAVTHDIKMADEVVHSTLRSTVPGLVPTSQADGAVFSGSVADEAVSVNKHRNIVPANPFNVTTLFQPTLAFINRASASAPPGFEDEAKAFGVVLEDFVVHTFLPQLDERVTKAFQQAVSGHDLRQDGTQAGSTSSVRVMELIQTLCVMLHTTPFHRENYSRLVVGVIVQYYQQCSARFKELVSNLSEVPMALPAVWAQNPEIIDCLSQVRAVASADPDELHLIGVKEVKLETELLKGFNLHESHLINSSRRFEALCFLASDLRSFIDDLLDLQVITEDEPQTMDTTRLPLTAAMAQRYEAIVQTYEQLVEMVLNTIRLEIRCRSQCNIRAALQKSDLRLESEALEPDPDILDLAGHLTTIHSLVDQSQRPSDKEFIFRGLAQLVDHLFINSSRSITVINALGVHKIKRNISAVLQTLRAISLDEQPAVLQRAFSFWDLYAVGPKDMLDALKTSKPSFAFEDYNAMLNLQCKTGDTGGPSSELNTYLIDLHALSMSTDGWETSE